MSDEKVSAALLSASRFRLQASSFVYNYALTRRLQLRPDTSVTTTPDKPPDIFFDEKLWFDSPHRAAEQGLMRALGFIPFDQKYISAKIINKLMG